MDDRQRQIREGAGQLESRLNQEFIEFLQKWSMPLLVIVALGAVGYAGWSRIKASRIDKVNTAFMELEAASNSANPSPESLKRVADEYEGVRAVSHLARLDAADAYLKSVRLGCKPGAELNNDGTLKNPGDALTEQDVVAQLNQANSLYQQVADATAGKPEYVLHRINALYGLAAVAESRKLPDEATRQYEQVIALTKDTAYKAHAKIAADRIKGLSDLNTGIRVYSKAELAPLPELPPAPSPEVKVLPPGDGSEAGAPTEPKPEAPTESDSRPEAPKEPAEPAPTPK